MIFRNMPAGSIIGRGCNEAGGYSIRKYPEGAGVYAGIMSARRMAEAFGDETRYRILELLRREGPMSANELARRLGKHRATIDKHLKLLSQAGLVTRKEDPESGVFLYMLTEGAESILKSLEEAAAAEVRPAIKLPVRKRRLGRLRPRMRPALVKVVTYGPPIVFTALGLIGFAAPVRGVHFITRMIWLLLFLGAAIAWTTLFKRLLR